jgi:DNA-binding CsgD family transcriptional regulator
MQVRKIVPTAKTVGRKGESGSSRAPQNVQDLEERFRFLLESVLGHAVAMRDASRDLVAALKMLAEHKSVRVIDLPPDGRWRDRDRSMLEVLTKRQRETLKLLAEGKSTKEVASELGISPKTADAHRAHIMHKLALRSQSELIFFAIRAGIITP